MSAVINLFKSAFDTGYETIKIDEPQRISDTVKLDFANCIISVNGNKQDETYTLKDGDIATIRQFPSNAEGWAVAGGVAGWVLNPILSILVGVTTGQWDGTINNACRAIRDSIVNGIKQGTETSGSAESIATVSGGKNQSGAGKVIPLLLGESLYTPVMCAQSYTDIDPDDGSDGENQYFHALYCLGYNDIDLRSVSLGIFPISTDRQNGTSSESLNCKNTVTEYASEEITLSYNSATCKSVSPDSSFAREVEIVFSLPIGKSDYDIINPSVKNYDFIVTCKEMSLRQEENSTGIRKTYANIKSVNIDNSMIIVKAIFRRTYTASNLYYAGLSGNVTLTCETKRIKNTLHYDVDKYKQELEFRQHGEEVSLFPQKVVQETSGAELLHPEGADALIVQPFSAKYPQKVQIEIQFQNLMKYNDDGKEEDNEVEIGVAYSMDGGASYKPFNAFYAKNSGITINGNRTGTFTGNQGNGQYRITKFTGKKNKAMRFVAEKTFSFDEVFNTDTETKLKNNAVEFKVFRIGEDKSTSDSKLQYKVYFSSIRTWCYDYKLTKKAYEENGSKTLVIQRPMAEKYRNMTARLGFKIKAGDEISGQLDELNVIQCSRARYCTVTENEDGEKKYTWSDPKDTVPTNNPASLALLILQHQMRGAYAYDDTWLDMDSFGRFYEWCNRTDTSLVNSDFHRYTANGVLSKSMKTSELVNQILACGHGKLVLNGNRYGVWFDCPQDTPVMVLNAQNILEATNTKNFNDEIDGYSCKYNDSLNDYQEDTQICVPKNLEKDEAEYKLENIETPWITDIGRVYRHCMYSLACKKLRPEIWQRKVSVDGNLVEIGSLVEIQDDTISVGIGEGAEIASVQVSGNYITSITVDYPFTVSDVSKTYGVKIQQADEINGVKVRTYELSPFAEAGEHTVLVFAGDGVHLDESVSPSVGDIVSFGLYEKITTSALCFGKKDNGDNTYTLSLVPYQEGIYEAEEGEIPEFVSNVTSLAESGTPIDEEIPSPGYDGISGIVEKSRNDLEKQILELSETIDVNKYVLDISPESQSVPVDGKGDITAEWIYFSAYLYYKDEVVNENVTYKVYLKDGTSEVGFWDGNTVRISTTYIKGDILYLTVKAVYEIDELNIVRKEADVQISKLYGADSAKIYKMLFNDGEKVKVDDAGEVIDPDKLRVTKRVATASGENNTGYGNITLEIVPDGTESDFEAYSKVEENENYSVKKSYYNTTVPFVLKIEDGTVLGESEKNGALFFEETE